MKQALLELEKKFSPEKMNGTTIHTSCKEDVVQVVQWANEHSIPLSINKENTEGVYIVTSDWPATIDVYPDDLIARVSPNVIPAAINEEANKHGLMYPPDASGQHTSTIADHLAMNASGAHRLKYGVTKNFVIGLEIVTPEGRLIRTGGRTIKNVTGYDVTKLIVGARGALGFITEATLKLMPQPPAHCTLIATFNDLEKAGEAARNVYMSHILPAKMALKAVDKPQLLIALDGQPKTVEAQAQTLTAMLGEVNVTEGEGNALWDTYREERPGVRANIPVNKLQPFFQHLKDTYGGVPSLYGHVGDGMWYITVHLREGDPDLFFQRKEHSPAARTLMTEMKRRWDPQGIIRGKAGMER
ncbi:glycolate oxidase [Geomicrobium halophilum]|uniref:Glycolate oxidase n=1 Tax=Geomicrobium halophilum TaxID=549000 RepID=A0A841PRH9_9BACL|nr:FAD-binding protein [Geomicrobium halophilum]MBB6450414.1 glycolate oxidase [Geomicrobium halophilum]